MRYTITIIFELLCIGLFLKLNNNNNNNGNIVISSNHFNIIIGL